ncbi:MAG TPA: tRNA pseudouridine(38-40) synthase TruA [Streptosporangiaceae bacterium]|nr:tRNA pseudouridine(38-40) synthase TruA [Streptosporangiaceae bacterium]
MATSQAATSQPRGNAAEVGKAPGAEPGACRLRLQISYDGAEFSGWARQPGQRTVQQVLEEALGHVLRTEDDIRLTVAGRTDAGVHARGQVAHVDVPERRWAVAAPVAERRLAGLLPPDVRIHQIEVAPAGFDARFSALWRRYSYRVCDRPSGQDPLRRHETLWHRRRVDVSAMNAAAAYLVGEHDFAAFCRRREGATTIRELLRLDWVRPESSLAVATVIADAFCHSMVRALVGALLKVGEGAHPPHWAADVLAARLRDPAVPVVPPHGLCLEEVRYPPPEGLAERAHAARRLRG